MNKIQKLDFIACLLNETWLSARILSGKKLVHCHGCFDLLHVAHIKHLQSAKKLGDILVVTVTPDEFVDKGPGRPVFNQVLRAEAVAALDCVDYVAINEWPIAVEAIKILRPNVFIKGGEFRDKKDLSIQKEEDAVKSAGGRIEFTDDIVYSSSSLINQHASPLSSEAIDFIARFKSQHSSDDVLQCLDKARNLRVLVVGEVIVDEYHHCQAMGKSGKEPILAVKETGVEKFAGGSIAVANHIASFCDNVSLLTCLGWEETQEVFVRSKLNHKVVPTFFYQPNCPTIVKQRFIEEYPFQKMFEVYQYKENEDEKTAEKFNNRLAECLPNFDLVVVVDYGHGLLNEKAIVILSNKAKCLAVNVQTNGANHGFNTVSKYPRADYICISESELRIEVKNHKRDLLELMSEVANRMGCNRVTATRGRQGVLCGDNHKCFAEVPSFTNKFTDRVGAGDAVFAITSLVQPRNSQVDVLGFIGNMVGAKAVEIIGNKTFIDRESLVRSIKSILK